MQLGLVGLGRMGANMGRRLAAGGHEVVAWDRNAETTRAFAGAGQRAPASLDDLVAALTPPRAVWVMVPAGDATEQTVTALAYIAAYAALALVPATGFALAASVPLALSLLVVAARFGWQGVAVLGVASTYALFVLRAAVVPDGSIVPGSLAPLLTLGAYWVMFEAADVAAARGRVGGSLSLFYQSQAERPTITETPGGDPVDLPGAGLIAADAMLLQAAHVSRAVMLRDWIDPSVRDENDPEDRDPELDLYDRRNPNQPPYTPEFLERFRAAQLERGDVGRLHGEDAALARLGLLAVRRHADLVDVVEAGHEREEDRGDERRLPAHGATSTRDGGRPRRSRRSARARA